jgi:Putative Actinobacterial Holin-X, holin superfamily III
MQSVFSRLGRAAALCLVAACVAVLGILYLSVALYFALVERTSPAIAALVTGGAALAVAVVIALAARHLARRAVPRTAPDGGDTGALATELGELLGARTSNWTRSHPLAASGIALLAGFAVGMSPGLRRTLRDLLR